MSTENTSQDTQIRFSASFEISRYAEKTPDQGTSHRKPSIRVQFQLAEGKPVRLGDGSYGAVYLGYDEAAQEDVAIKLFYDNYALTPRRLSELSDEELEWFIDSLVEKHLLDPIQLKKLILGHKGSDYALLTKLQEEYNKAEAPSAPPDFISFLDDLTRMASSSAVYRFRSERIITGLLIDSNARKGEEMVAPPGLVKVLGGTEDFHKILSSKEFEKLREYFNGQKSPMISTYVLVMERYSYSLKDLLERSIKSNDSRNGYEVLRELPHDLRVREALIVLADVAFGLYQLHNVDYAAPLFHLDIKPGNIFIKEKTNDKFQVALGDLGNLPLLPDTAASNGTFVTPLGHDYAPGTQHYRSPEQKYYMDVADVQVKHIKRDELEKSLKQIIESEAKIDSNSAGNTSLKSASATNIVEDNDNDQSNSKLVVLIVQDPKFKNTLIEEGDVVIFSKDTKRNRCMISDIVVNDQAGYFAYVLSDNLAENPFLLEDKKTQVEFYKKQSYRTDLFGIGAVVFDVITAGWSPEKFYESIRKFESKSVEEIVNQYRTLRGGEIEGENPDLSQIFEPFRNDKDPAQRYPESDIVRFILKCMLYQSPGTFYQESKLQPQEASRMLSAEINDLLSEYKYKQLLPKRLSDKSILIDRPKDFDEKTAEESVQFDQEIARLQGLEPWLKVNSSDPLLVAANRLLFGAYYFSQIVELVRAKISTGQQSPYLRQILPAYISLKWEAGKAVPDFDPAPSWQLETTLLKDLRDNRLEQLIRSPTNSFVPSGIAGMRRDIRLFVQNDQKHADKDRHVSCIYRFRDASLFGLKASPGDWLICQEQLWEVVEPIDHNVLTVKLKSFEDETRNYKELVGMVDGIYFSALRPFKYYLDMLGIYLQHLIFAHSPTTTTTRDRINISTLLNAFEIGPTIYIHSPDTRSIDKAASSPSNELRAIYTNFVYLLLKLTLHESEDSYYRQMVSKKEEPFSGASRLDRTVLNVVKKDAFTQYERILKMLKITEIDSADSPEPLTTLDNLPEFMMMVEDLMKDRFDIEKTIKRSGMVAWK